jgi:uncharacterized protein YaaW (UPF0174 family)
MDALRQLLQRCTAEELTGLAKILEANNNSVDKLIETLWQNCQSTLSYLFGREPAYKQIVHQVADHLSVPYKQYHSAREVEIAIAQKVLETLWQKMTPEQRQEMEEQLQAAAQEFDKTGAFTTGGSIFATLTAARLSGFGVYLLASTALGAVTSALGIALPFVVYTTMSSAIGVILGPVGWISAGLYTLWRLDQPNYKRLTAAVLYICLLRSRHAPESTS